MLFAIFSDMFAKRVTSQGIRWVLMNQFRIKPVPDAIVHLIAIHQSSFFSPLSFQKFPAGQKATFEYLLLSITSLSVNGSTFLFI
jgi:hypothetical protein